MDRPIAGFECDLYYDSVGTAGGTPTWAEIKNAKDVNFPDAADEIEVSARYSDRKKYIAGMFDGAIEFGYQFVKGTDAVFTALQTKYLSRTPIQVAAADGPIATPGTIYSRDWYMITKFEKSEELAGSVTYSITLRPTVVFNAGAMVEKTYVTVPEA